MNKRSYSDFVVMKFGGSSVGNAERIREVGKLIRTPEPKIVVLSAMSGVTNTLVEISDLFRRTNTQGALELIDKLREKYTTEISLLYSNPEVKEQALSFVCRKMDFLKQFKKELFTEFEEKQVLAQGEIISTMMMRLHLRDIGIQSTIIPALSYMSTDKYGEPAMGRIQSTLIELLRKYPEENLFITEGYICQNAYAEVDNLKRGGSDYTASIVGAALDAKEIQIWTDIDGLHNNDPRVVPKTKAVRSLHFDEAAELAYFGAKILHPTCIQPAKMANIPVRLLNTMEPTAKGTLISNRIVEGAIKAVAAKDNITVVRIISTRMLLAHGFLRRVFEVFERYQTPIDMVTTSEVAVSVSIDSTSRLEEILAELKKFSTVSLDEEMTIICIAGDLNWKNVGFEAAVIEAMGDIPVRMISYGGSNHNVSVLIRTADKVKALTELNARLFDL